MMGKPKMLSRRDFLKASALTAGALALPKAELPRVYKPQTYPDGANLGRICAGDIGAWTEVKSEPNISAPMTARIYRDEIVEVKHEVIASSLDLNRINQRWVETPQGYIYSPYVQPVKNKINKPLDKMPLDDEGKPGMWVEITVPITGLELTRTPASFWLKDMLVPKLYYSMIFWALDLRQNNGKTEYLLTQLYGAAPDTFWVDATACKPLTKEDTSPIRPEAQDKIIKIDLNYQTLSCYEGKNEVYYCDISSGGKKTDGTWSTPVGEHIIWRKLVSIHMSAGGLWAFDSPGIGWVTLFDSNGAAIHSAYWHNNFSTAISHGCVNCRPDDAQFIWRWTLPEVNYYPGELTVRSLGYSTHVDVHGT
ncbi:MAG: L,D-transpeptidase family protein [Anaerolineaceae bacterium]|nr:L,D-transpeptidase family protein [Anaerolineaceae bacterium]